MSHPEVTASSTQPVPKVIELPGAPPFREWHIECPIHGPQTVRTYMRNGLFGEPKCYICQREEGEKMARSEAIKGEALATTIALQNFFGPSIGGDDSSACFTFDAGLFDEAQLVASGNLESFENEVNAEVVFSPDAQIPIENIEILNATASDSIFGTDTPPKDQNAAERKSEAISKPKRKRVSSSVVKGKPEDISQEVWDDWLTTRRAKRLPLTQTALNSVRREAASAGLTFQAAVTFAVEQGWAAFRAEWYRNATRKGDSTKTNARYLTAQERYEERMRKAGEMSDEEYFAQFDLPEEILNYEKAQEAKRHVAS